jgi:hypothetical protein
MSLQCGTIGGQAQGRRPARRIAVIGTTGARTERADYDAAAVADELVTAGLPPDYAAKLLAAV